MERVIGEKDGLRVRKKIKFRASKKPSRVMLQRPGVNLPTFGALTILVIHAWVVLTGGVTNDAGELRSLYSNSGVSWKLLSEGKIWGIVTHSLLHGGWLHVSLNALLFYYACARVGHVLTQGKLLLLFAIASAGAALGHSLAQGIFTGLPQHPLVGASGGVMGLLLAQTVLYPDSRMLLLSVSGRNMAKGVLVASVTLFMLTPGLNIPLFSQLGSLIATFFGPELFMIGHLYHFIAGVIGVVLVDRLLPRMVTLNELQTERARNESADTLS